MKILIIFLVAAGIIVILGLVVLFFILWSFCANLTTHVPWAKIPNKNIEIILKSWSLPNNALIFDLGCGDGRFLFAAEKKGYKGVGYEISLYPYLKAIIKKFLYNSNINFKLSNFYSHNINKADAVFIFLVDKVMKNVSKKLVRELKPGAHVASYGFELPTLKITKILNTKPSKTYFYKI